MARLPKGMKPVAGQGGAPRRARSAYFLWCDAVRASHAETPDAEMAGKSMAVASKVLSARWKALTPEQRAPFQQQASALKAELKLSKRAAVAEGSRAPLPSGWKAVRDAMTGRVGYACVVSGRCQWTRPSDEDAVPMPPPQPTARRVFEQALRAASTEPLGAKALNARWAALGEAERELYAREAAAQRAARNRAGITDASLVA